MTPGCRLLLCAFSFAVAATPVLGQSRADQDYETTLEQQREQQQRLELPPQGHVGESAIGRVGERQRREDAAPNLHPTERISTRIENRLQTRIRNRIDRDYDPQANIKSPFETAEEKARAASDRAQGR